jgi:hypothetical protein
VAKTDLGVVRGKKNKELLLLSLFRLLSEPFQKGTKNSLSLRTWTGR